MENYFIIASHSTFAEGIYNCLKFFKGDIENVYYINAYVESTNFEEIFEETICKLKDKNVIVLTDLPGGSVNQICNKQLQKYDFHLVSGVNFPLALELIFQENKIDSNEIKRIIDESKNQIIYMNDLKMETILNDDEEL